MKTKYTLLTGLAMLAMSAAFGQGEFDDMYFSSKDRAKLNATKDLILAKQYQQEDLQAAKVSPINPTDSYSGRSVNPEYTNRLKTNPNLSSGSAPYFSADYQPTNVNQNLASNSCKCNSNYYSPNTGYGMSPYYGMNSFYGMNSGFGSPYSSYYSPYGMGMGMGSGFYPGMSTMLGYSFGGMSSGWFGGMSYGFGSGYGNPYGYGYGGSSFYNGYGAYGMPYGYGAYGSNYYGNNVIVNGGGGDYQQIAHGKRASRSSDTDNVIDRTRSESGYTRTGRSVATTNGRSSAGNSQTQYYDRGWKRDPDKNPSRSFWSDNGSSNNSGSRTGWNTGSSSGRQSSSSGWGDNSSRGSFSNSGNSSFGGASRSSGGGSFGGSSGGGGGGGGHSRGRD